MDPIFLDTETGGFDPAICGIVEIAVIDHEGEVLLNTLVNPVVPIPEAATAVHGITDAMVAGRPTLAEVLPLVLGLARGHQVVIYNSVFDTKFLPGLKESAGSVECCMMAAMRGMQQTKWPKLSAAALWAGVVWKGNAHRALSDTYACRDVWLHVQALTNQTAEATGA